ncbi:MAG: BamA/TamA family outer membrane protein [Alphaproteobacteria bacterium]|nr:BamA/TamA family outer membrane protein [Alphaproteobacteria bacterium]
MTRFVSICRAAGVALGIFIVVLGAPNAAQDAYAQSFSFSEKFYQISFKGLGDDEEGLEDAMRASSLSVQLQGEKPRSLAGLRRRAERDISVFEQVLRSYGFYDGTVRYEVIEAQESDEKPDLVFTITRGNVYLLDAITIQEDGTGKPQEADDALLKVLGLELGQAATADSIISAEDYLVRHYRSTGYPTATAGTRRTTINRETYTMSVRFGVVPGPKAVFGELKIEGLTDVEEKFVRRNVTWVPGSSYDIGQVEETQRKLSRTGLFNTITLVPLPISDNAGQSEPVPVDIQLTVAERDHRSIGFGTSYSTSIGPGVSAFWEHRNLFSNGERFRGTVSASPVERGVDGTFRKPLYKRVDQALVAEGELKDITSDAYDEIRSSSFVGLERRLSPIWTATIGPTLDIIQQTDQGVSVSAKNDHFTLLGMRGSLRRDTTDNPLDPSEGSRLELGLSPYTDLGNSTNFVSSAITASQYLKIDDSGDFILAGRVRLGSIFGADRESIPAGKRLYAGGGGSVRGFGYQKLGPLDSELDPIGGRSVVEFGIELRTRLTETIGLVPFIEAGNVYESTVPDISANEIRWSGGLGLRYFTAIGPVRLDIATPFRKRPNVDDSYQLYVSLGQAF